MTVAGLLVLLRGVGREHFAMPMKAMKKKTMVMKRVKTAMKAMKAMARFDQLIVARPHPYWVASAAILTVVLS